MVDLFFEEISTALAAGDDVKLSGFGSFKIREKNERIGRNPRTKEKAIIAPRKVITFSASPNLRETVDPGSATQNRPAVYDRASQARSQATVDKQASPA